MAVSRVKWYFTKEPYYSHILYHLVDIYGDKMYEIVGFKKKVLGYGLQQFEFSTIKDTVYPITERMFREYKDELLARLFIEEVYARRKDKRPRYVITPLGITYLISRLEIFDKELLTTIYKILSQYSNPKDNSMKIDNKTLKLFTGKQIDQALKQVGYFTEVLLEKYFTGMRFDFYLFKSKNRTRVFQGVVTPTGFVEEKTWLLSHDSRDLDNGLNVKRDRFYHQISYSFNIMLSYYLVHTLEDMDKLKKMPNPFRQLVATSFNHIFDDLEWSRTKEKYVEIITSL